MARFRPPSPRISGAIDGRSGFRFQLKNSVLGDGVWYEGARGYHFYALDAHTPLAEMAARAAIDLWPDPRVAMAGPTGTRRRSTTAAR